LRHPIERERLCIAASKVAGELVSRVEPVLRPLDWRELVAAMVDVADGGVEAVLGPAAAERRIGPLARDARSSENERAVDGHALGDVTGDRVAVCDRSISMLGAAQQEASVELDPVRASVDGDGHLPPSGIHREHAAAVAVVYAGGEVVAPDDDAIADGEALAVQP